MGNLRVVIALLGGLVALMSVPPLRLRVPLVRSLPAWVEALMWPVLALLCVAAFAEAQSAKSLLLAKAMVRSALVLADQAFGSAIAYTNHWFHVHEQPVVLAIVGALGLCWLFAFGRAISGWRERRQPAVRLGSWWLYRFRSRKAPTFPQPPLVVASGPARLTVAQAAAFLGVSRSSVYRWAGNGRLRCVHTPAGLFFDPADVASLRVRRRGPRALRRQSRPAA